jgi:hypothetical protein
MAAIASCGSSDSEQRAAPPQTSASAPAKATSTAHRAKASPQRKPTPKVPVARPTGLVFSSAGNNVVQPQPAPDSCHARGSGLFSEPDPGCTPGALNPTVSQANIDQTICVHGWSETVRPPERVTEKEKVASIAAYGDIGSVHEYEYDHLVSLELGGATNDPRNLWPEPGASPNPKDAVEDTLHSKVCDGTMALREAQHIIATQWVKLSRTSSSGSG